MSQWYVIKTKPHRELGVHTALSKAQFNSFLPRIRHVQHRFQTTHLNIKPLFPNYLFIHVDFTDPRNINFVKYTRGVSHILCADNTPVPISEEIIHAIQTKMNDQGYVEKPVALKKGDRIRVRSKGILQDLEGIFEKETSDQERVVVLLNLINHTLKATLHWSEVERVKVA